MFVITKLAKVLIYLREFSLSLQALCVREYIAYIELLSNHGRLELIVKQWKFILISDLTI